MTDGQGGAVFSWYSKYLQVHAQHVSADGISAYPHNGAVVSTDLKQARVEPTVAYFPETKEVTLFWMELGDHIYQSTRGLYAQRLNARGERQWGDSGVVIQPLSKQSYSSLQSVAVADGTFGFWVQNEAGSQFNTIQAIKLDPAGVPSCTQFPISTRPSDKSRLMMGQSSWGQTLLAWQDESEGRISDIYAQSVYDDCRLGSP